MAPCFAPRCTSGYKGKSTHGFRPDINVGQEWTKILSKMREDKLFDPKNSNHRLCHLHFESHLVIKADEFVIRGEIVKLDRQKWKLAPGAIPTIFPQMPSYRQGKLPKKRRSTEKHEVPEKKISPLEEFQKSWTPFEGWQLESINVDMKKALKFFNNDHKTIEVFEDMTVKIYINSLQTNHKNFLEATRNVTLSKDRIHKLLSEVGGIHRCRGISGYHSISFLKKGIKIDDLWFSKLCNEYGNEQVCLPCKLLVSALSKQNMLQKNVAAKRISKILNRKCLKKCLNLEKKYKYAIRANTKLKMELKRIKIALKHVSMVSVDKFLKSDKIAGPFRNAVSHALKLMKVKSSKGIRYEVDWLLECLLLKIKSPAAYKHIRNSKLLPLPHPSTLARLISGQQCEFGFNSVSLDCIKKEFANKPSRDRQGSLIFDEIQLRETLDFNKGTKKLDGYIDYAEYTTELLSDADKGALADHALVIMYRPFTSKWIQPIAAFATKGAAKGNVLQKIIIEAVIRLESVGAEVVNIVADGAKPNKSFWKKLGISGKAGFVVNKIVHPCDNTRNLYFLCDVPHLMKCIRNNFRKYLIVKYNGKDINYNYYEELFKEDQKRKCGLRKCPKITASHISPNNFEKMNVALATQLFSRSVATGLEFYRKENIPAFKDSENTQLFTQCMNNLFDALNCRFSSEGLKIQSPQMNCIKDWLAVVNVPAKKVGKRKTEEMNTFASSETLSALRITLKSVIEITEYLICQKTFKYVLTGKLNQDPCERFFGLVRGAGGHEDHPTVCNFLQIYRILSLYTPTKVVLKGNVSPSENETVLVDFQESLKKRAKLTAKSKLEWKDSVNNILQLKIANKDKFSCKSSLKLDSNIVYHVCGYLVFKARKFIKCEECLLSLQSTNLGNLPEVANMTKIMDYGQHLKYPSERFFNLIRFNIEPTLVKMIENGNLYGDIVVEILTNVNNFSLNGIGCTSEHHKFDLVCKLIPYYIVTRLYFYVRSVRNDLGHGKATKGKRKMSKLQSK